MKKILSLLIIFFITASTVPVLAQTPPITGLIFISPIDDFSTGTARDAYKFVDDSDGEFYDLIFSASAGRKFNSGERITISDFVIKPEKILQVANDTPASVRRLDTDDNSQPFGPLVPVDNSFILNRPKASSLGALGTQSVVRARIQNPLPAFNSNPSALVKLFIDLDGAPAFTWNGTPATETPPFDTDGNTNSFSVSETALAMSILRRVAEMYSHLNVNVTNVDPGVYNNGETIRIIVGGNGSWYGSNVGGTAFIDSFTNLITNTAFVFPANLNNNAGYISEAITHEAGHTFGLRHQSSYSAAGVKTEYNIGDSLKSPIMGNPYKGARAVWWLGPSSLGPTSIQDDIMVLTKTANNITVKTDDRGGSTGTAFELVLSNDFASATGIIETTVDTDWYKITLPTGNLSVTTTVPIPFTGENPMLDSTLKLFDTQGNLLQTADTSALGESIQTEVTGGVFYIGVYSKAIYGDIGQYNLSVQVAPTGGSNNAPVANNMNVTVTEDLAKSFTLTGSDQDGNPITFSVVTGPAHGTLSGAVPHLIYTPAPDFFGSDSISFRANDGQANSTNALVTLNVEPVDDAPQATPQSINANHTAPAVITLRGLDIDTIDLTFTVVSQPSYGILSGTAPDLIYTPDAGYLGPDSLTFKVSDGTTESSATTVNIQVTGSPLPPSTPSGIPSTGKNIFNPARGESAFLEVVGINGPTSVSILIYDRNGSTIREFQQDVTLGSPTIQWDGRNESRQIVASGAYRCRIQNGSTATTKTIVVIK